MRQFLVNTPDFTLFTLSFILINEDDKSIEIILIKYILQKKVIINIEYLFLDIVDPLNNLTTFIDCAIRRMNGF